MFRFFIRPACLALVLGGAGAFCPAADDPRAGLRAAIDDLAATFGKDYPHAVEFRGQLEALAANDAAGLEALKHKALLANPLLRPPLLFVARAQFAPDHHNTETFFQKGEINTGSYRPGGALKVLDVASGQTRTLLESGPEGLVRDPDVSFDGQQILFSWRKSRDDGSHLFRLKADGTELKQLTGAEGVNDIDPAWLPDGGIVFTSTREPKYCGCNRHIMGNLFRMEADGANILQIGRSTLHEGHSTVMPDGRILYDRWEYIDRNFGDAQALWAVNPDGTAHTIFWGSNLCSPGGVIDARMVPGSGLCLAVLAACHDRPWGALGLIDRNKGVDAPAAVLRTWPPEAVNLVGKGGFDSTAPLPVKYEDPYPLGERWFLASRMAGPRDERMVIVLLDTFGNEVVVHAEDKGCFDPMPLAPRPLPPAIPTRRDYTNGAGRFYVQDVSIGTHLAGVRKDEIKFLRVIESPEKRGFSNQAWGGQGAQAPAMNWHNFENKRILGTVPVEADGSVYFEVPSDRYVFFQLLDKDKRMIQSMRSGTIIQSGETQGCVGCHESRTGTPPPVQGTLALAKPAQSLDGWFGPPRLFSFLTEVQPVFDKHCVNCHDFGNPQNGGLVLARDRETVFNAAYTEIWSKGMVHCVGGGPAEIQPARSWGASVSRLVKALDKGHYDVKLSPEEMERLTTWVDLNAPYYPSYLTSFPDFVAGRVPLDGARLSRLGELTGLPLAQEADHGRHRAWISFDRPERSPALDRITDKQSPAYAEALALIESGKKNLGENPRGDTADFTPCAADQAREKKYGARAQAEADVRQALRDGRKVYDPGVSP